MAAETPMADRLDVDDGLEPPTLQPRVLAWIGVGAVVFILTAMVLLMSFYQLLLKNPARQPLHAFPDPRLETNIDPRSVAATPEPGPAPLVLKRPPAEPAGDMDRAMATIAAKGAHAFDPLPVATANVGPAANTPVGSGRE